MQNGRVESFHGKLRDECLNVSWFRSLFNARTKIAVWRKDYSNNRRHSSLNYLTPEAFAALAASPSKGLSIALETGGQGNPAGSLRSVLTASLTPQFGIACKGEAEKSNRC